MGCCLVTSLVLTGRDVCRGEVGGRGAIEGSVEIVGDLDIDSEDADRLISISSVSLSSGTCTGAGLLGPEDT